MSTNETVRERLRAVLDANLCGRSEAKLTPVEADALAGELASVVGEPDGRGVDVLAELREQIAERGESLWERFERSEKAGVQRQRLAARANECVEIVVLIDRLSALRSGAAACSDPKDCREPDLCREGGLCRFAAPVASSVPEPGGDWSAVDIIAEALYDHGRTLATAVEFDALSADEKVQWRTEAAGLLHEIGTHEVADQMDAAFPVLDGEGDGGRDSARIVVRLVELRGVQPGDRVASPDGIATVQENGELDGGYRWPASQPGDFVPVLALASSPEGTGQASDRAEWALGRRLRGEIDEGGDARDLSDAEARALTIYDAQQASGLTITEWFAAPVGTDDETDDEYVLVWRTIAGAHPKGWQMAPEGSRPDDFGGAYETRWTKLAPPRPTSPSEGNNGGPDA